MLQIEFQVSDELEMVYRMAEYNVMLLRLYKIPVRQFAIFLGKGKPKMTTELFSGDLTFKYHLLSIKTIDYKVFLKSNKPEEIVFAVLSNFGLENQKMLLEQLFVNLKKQQRQN